MKSKALFSLFGSISLLLVCSGVIAGVCVISAQRMRVMELALIPTSCLILEMHFDSLSGEYTVTCSIHVSEEFSSKPGFYNASGKTFDPPPPVNSTFDVFYNVCVFYPLSTEEMDWACRKSALVEEVYFDPDFAVSRAFSLALVFLSVVALIVLSMCTVPSILQIRAERRPMTALDFEKSDFTELLFERDIHKSQN
jgi:hypothetical protein